MEQSSVSRYANVTPPKNIYDKIMGGGGVGGCFCDMGDGEIKIQP